MNITWLLFFGGLVCWICYLVNQSRVPSQSQEKLTSVSSAILQVKFDINGILGSIELLKGHSDRYFHTLQGAGFSELGEIGDALFEIMIQLDELFAEKKLGDCIRLCEWLSDTDRPLPVTSTTKKEAYLRVANWQARANDLILRCTTAAAEAVEENQQLGVQRHSRPRAPTQFDLQKLRASILPK